MIISVQAANLSDCRIEWNRNFFCPNWNALIPVGKLFAGGAAGREDVDGGRNVAAVDRFVADTDSAAAAALTRALPHRIVADTVHVVVHRGRRSSGGGRETRRLQSSHRAAAAARSARRVVVAVVVVVVRGTAGAGRGGGTRLASRRRRAVLLSFQSHPASRFIRYNTRCYFNVRSKADMSQLNLPHGTDN